MVSKPGGWGHFHISFQFPKGGPRFQSSQAKGFWQFQPKQAFFFQAKPQQRLSPRPNFWPRGPSFIPSHQCQLGSVVGSTHEGGWGPGQMLHFSFGQGFFPPLSPLESFRAFSRPKNPPFFEPPLFRGFPSKFNLGWVWQHTTISFGGQFPATVSAFFTTFLFLWEIGHKAIFSRGPGFLWEEFFLSYEATGLLGFTLPSLFFPGVYPQGCI